METKSDKFKKISIETVHAIYNEAMGLLANMQVKGNVDIERELIRIMNDHSMDLLSKYNSIRVIHTQVFGMIYGDGRPSVYR